MARNRVDYCIICGQTPCACSKQHKIQPKKATKLVPTVVAPTGVPAEGRVNLANIPKIITDEQREFNCAVTVLADADLLHRDELERHRASIELPSHRIDALIWRQDVYRNNS